jgi:cytochrome c556
MKINFTALAAIVLLGAFASDAMAAQAVTAKLQAPVEGRKKPVAGDAVFVCEADACTAASPSGSTSSVSSCRQLVRAVGAVTSFGSDDKPFDADKLGRCNSAAAKK